MTESIKRIPYGIGDYHRLKQDNMYYVDKTRFIPHLEAAPYYLIFIRPRRFGKSLLLSMLQEYYDINRADNFGKLFGDTWIGTNPTPERHSYLVMTFNFAMVAPGMRDVEQSFEMNGLTVIRNFLKRYAAYFTEPERREILDLPTTVDSLRELFSHLAIKKHQLYLFIDEYDNFANTILTTAGEAAYRELTHGAGFFRYFFNLLKGATGGTMPGLTRLFVTGVSPLTMDDVTSGFNIGDNLTLEPEFNELLGFNEEEVAAILQYYREAGYLTPHAAASEQLVRSFYGGYRFAQQAETYLYNADMVWHFIKQAGRRGGIPENLIDNNVRTDYNKLRHLLTIDRRLNGNFSYLREIITDGQTTGNIVTSFPAERLTDAENFISLLYYMGLLTFNGLSNSLPVLCIPNLTIRELMYSYLRDGIHDTDVFRINVHTLANKLNNMANRGEWYPLFDFIAKEISHQASVRDYLSGEKVIQGFILAYLNVTNFFLTWSEREMGGGFVDICLEPFLARYPELGYGYLIELKYIPRQKFTEAHLAETITEAKSQLRKYRADSRIVAMAENVTIKCLILVFHGWELVYQDEV